MTLNSRPALSRWLRDQGVAVDEIEPASALGALAMSVSGSRGRSQRLADRSAQIRVLTLICQKIVSTGSGVVVRETVNGASRRGARVMVISGCEPGDDPAAEFAGQNTLVTPVVFQSSGADGLPFPIVGMSDRMPYESMTFRELSYAQLDQYLEVWRRHIRTAVRVFRPDVIHVHHLWLLAALCGLEAPGVPLVVSLHGTDLHQAVGCPHLTDLVRRWTHRCDCVLALTQQTSHTAREIYALPSNKCVVLGNGFNDALFIPSVDPRADVLARYGLTDVKGRRIVLFVGKFVEWKGVEWLLRAFATLGGRQDAVLVVVGGGPLAETQRYAQMAHDLGVKQEVRFMGHVRYEDVGAFMNAAHVVVLPSFQEPFGLVLLEALACGARVVSTDQGGPQEFVPNLLRIRRDAILVRGLQRADPTPFESAGFVERLASAMQEQLSKPLTHRERLDIARSVGHLSWADYAAKLLTIYGAVTA